MTTRVRTIFSAAALAGLAAGPARSAVFGGQTTYDARLVRGSFLGRGEGARAVGMGQAYTAVADDPTALRWNPAGLGQIGALATAAQYDTTGEGDGRTVFSSLAGALPVGQVVVGVAFQDVEYGDLVERDTTGTVLGTRRYADRVLAQGVAVRNPAWLGGAGWTGAGFEVVQEADADALAGFSLGTLVPVTREVMLGAALLHVSHDDAHALPETARLGTTWAVPQARVAVDLSYGMWDHLMAVAVGGEFRPVPFAAIRAGYTLDGRQQVRAGVQGVTAGLGLRYGRWGLDYAYQPFGDLATSHRVAIEFRLPARVRTPEAAVVTAPRPAAVKAKPRGTMPAALEEPEAPAVRPVRAAPAAVVPVPVKPADAPVPVRPAPAVSATSAAPEPPAASAHDSLLPPPAELDNGGDGTEPTDAPLAPVRGRNRERP